jgi:hypothetical protein
VTRSPGTVDTEPVVAVRVGVRADGMLGVVADLGVAEVAASYSPRGRAMLDGAFRTMGDLASRLARTASRASIWVDTNELPAFTMFADRYAAAFECAATVVPLQQETPGVPGLAASPVRTGVVPPRLAPMVGIRGGWLTAGQLRLRPAADIATDLGMLRPGTTTSVRITAVGAPTPASEPRPDLTDLLAQALADLAACLATTPVAVAWRIDAPASLWGVGPAGQAVAAGAQGVTLLVDGGTTASRLRRAISASEALGLRVEVRADRWRSPEELAELVTVAPDLSVVGPPPHLLAVGAGVGRLDAPTTARTLVTARQAHARLDSLVATAYGVRTGEASPLTSHVAAVAWYWSSDVEPYAEWLFEILGFSGAVVIPGSGAPTRTSLGTVVIRAGAPSAATPGAPLASPVVARYAEHPDAAPRTRTVLQLGTPDDVRALLDDAERAWHSGVLPPRLGHPLIAYGDLCRLTGEGCSAARPQRLVVDNGGAVRVAPGAPVLGMVGDPLRVLLAAARKTGAATGTGCGCRPEGWPPLRTPPWLSRVLGLGPALATIERHRPGVLTGGTVRVSGLGGPLLHGGPSAPRWPAGTALLRSGRDYYLCLPGRVLQLSGVMALAVEALLDHDYDAARAARAATAAGLPAELADEAVRRAGAAVGSASGADRTARLPERRDT